MSILAYLPKLLYSQWFVTPELKDRSFTGQTVIITGSNQGLGLEAAKHIVRLGAEKVILAVRDVEKGSSAKVEVERSTDRVGIVEVWQLDLQSYRSVKDFAQRATTLRRLDVVLENAGINTTKFAQAEGKESTLTTNVISTLLLALLLLPKLEESALKFNIQPHLTFVSSEVHFFSRLKQRDTSGSILDMLSERESFRIGDAYWTSKLLLILAIEQMVEKPIKGHSTVIVNHVNPGLCHSGLAREVGWPKHIGNFLFNARSTEVGSRTLVDAASFGPISHGKYLSDCHVASVSPFVSSEEGKEMGKKVWAELEEIFETIQPGVLALKVEFTRSLHDII